VHDVMCTEHVEILLFGSGRISRRIPAAQHAAYACEGWMHHSLRHGIAKANGQMHTV
jgi:hypothetical protein